MIDKNGGYTSTMLPILSRVLQVPQDQVLRRVVITPIAKCTPLGDVDQQTVLTCERRHLQREIRFWRPRIILAFGTRVARQLSSLNWPCIRIPDLNSFQSKEKIEGLVALARRKLRTLEEMGQSQQRI
jgi:hypothetical protein